MEKAAQAFSQDRATFGDRKIRPSGVSWLGFSSCKVKEIWVPMGHAYIINRLTLHGILPWKNETAESESSRMIAYFRPDLTNGEKRWLE